MNKQLQQTQTRMILKVSPRDLPSKEYLAAEVAIGVRKSVEGADPEVIIITLWRDGEYVRS